MSKIENRREVFGWAMFDFANSSFTTTMVTVYFSVYFKDHVAGGSDAAWGWLNGISLMIVVLAAPILGALTDFSGAKKRFLVVSWLGCVAATAVLSVVSGPDDFYFAAVFFIAANACFAAGENFVAAFLPEIAAPENVGRVSGYGWSIGYFGGIGSVILCAVFSTDLGPVAANRVVCLVTAGFFLFAGIPTMLWLRERGVRQPRPEGAGYLAIGFARVANTWGHIRRYRQLFRFLCVFLVFNCGVLTVVAFAVPFAKTTIGMTTSEVATLFIVINLAAAAGALGFGYLQDRIGSRRVIQATLLIWIVAVAGAAAAPSKAWFWAVGMLVGVAIGSTQSASRALVGLFSPESRSGEFLGFWGSFGKLSGVLAIPLFGVLSDAFSQRTAVSVCAVWFILGFIGMFWIDEKEGRRVARDGLDPTE